MGKPLPSKPYVIGLTGGGSGSGDLGLSAITTPRAVQKSTISAATIFAPRRIRQSG